MSEEKDFIANGGQEKIQKLGYWVQKDRIHGISQECAISPIFGNKEALIEWLMKARENGLTEYIICDDMVKRTWEERKRQVEKYCYIKKE